MSGNSGSTPLSVSGMGDNLGRTGRRVCRDQYIYRCVYICQSDRRLSHITYSPCSYGKRRMDRRIVSDAPVRQRPLQFPDRPFDRTGMARQNAPESWPPGSLRSQATARFSANVRGGRRSVTRAQRMPGYRAPARRLAAGIATRPASFASRGDTNMFRLMLSALVITLNWHAVQAQAPAPNVVTTEPTITATVDHIERSSRVVTLRSAGNVVRTVYVDPYGEGIRRPESGRRDHDSLRRIRRRATAARCGAQRRARLDSGGAEGRRQAGDPAGFESSGDRRGHRSSGPLDRIPYKGATSRFCAP